MYDESGRAGFCSRDEIDEALEVRRNTGDYSPRVLKEIQDAQLHEETAFARKPARAMASTSTIQQPALRSIAMQFRLPHGIRSSIVLLQVRVIIFQTYALQISIAIV